MAHTHNPPNPLFNLGSFLRRGETGPAGQQLFLKGGRQADVFYRDRWAFDKVVRSTHGVNCTGSCSWKVYVKDGVITWESQAVDYPTTGSEMPDYEPRRVVFVLHLLPYMHPQPLRAWRASGHVSGSKKGTRRSGTGVAQHC